MPDNKQDGLSSLKLRGYSTQLIFIKLRPRESSNAIESFNLCRILTCNLCFVATSCAVSLVEHMQWFPRLKQPFLLWFYFLLLQGVKSRVPVPSRDNRKGIRGKIVTKSTLQKINFKILNYVFELLLALTSERLTQLCQFFVTFFVKKTKNNICKN